MGSDFTSLLVGGGILTVIFSCWGHIKGIFNYLKSFLIVSFDIHGDVSAAIQNYCNYEFHYHKFGLRVFTSFKAFIKPQDRYETLGLETVGETVRVYRQGWRFIWINRTNSSTGGTEYTLWKPIKVSFIRGTFGVEDFIVSAINYYNDKVNSLERRRYGVIYCFGTAGKQFASNQLEERKSIDQVGLLSYKILNWKLDDIGAQQDKNNALQLVALNSDTEKIVNDVDRMLQNKKWFIERRIPWKYGALLYGKPGTGKTALVRAIGEHFNLPIYVYDLASMRNHELREKWNEMRTNLPAIALLEDIDSVFNKREKTDEKIELTFDCLLNCIDGVEQSNGLILFVTTNRIESIDEALHDQSVEGQSRPGRIDFSVELTDLDEASKRHIANRILQDWPEDAERLVSTTPVMTGAQFERLCIETALTNFWEKK